MSAKQADKKNTPKATHQATHKPTHNLPAFQRMQYDFAGWIRDPDPKKTPQNIERRRMNIYRELFLANVSAFLENAFPVSKDALGQQAWQPLVKTFFKDHLSQSPYFREIPIEFMTWLQQSGETKNQPPWLPELLHYEWLELETSTRDGGEGSGWPQGFGEIEPSAEKSVSLSPFFEMAAYQYPVQTISATNKPEQPSETPTFLVVYRRRDHKVRFITLTPQVALFLQALSETPDLTPRQALQEVEKQTGQPLYESWLTQTLQDLFERDILSGIKV